ncbi:MAG: bifunctional YncE family protein/alkaline phosphatase family protein [Chitinophagaceae bacterium]|jgi:YVTN family beta-propeller protein|nr:bifunctional YncE family protein/alkaline phosphatase family protein [Chitinophagaceae bacterium]
MKSFILFSICVLSFSLVQAQSAAELESKTVHLPNGWNLTPVGKNITLGDLPLNIAVSKNKKYLAVTNNGQSTQSIQLIDVAQEKILSDVKIPKSWYGLAFGDNDKSLYASGGNDERILKYAIVNNSLQLQDTIELGKKKGLLISPAGLTIDDNSHKMFVVTKEDNSLYVIDLKTKNILHKLSLGAEAYTCVLSKDNKTLFISLWGGDKLLYYNIDGNTISTQIPVGDNPNEICLSKNGKYLYVANANDNSVSVIDVQGKKVIEVLNAALYANAPSGSTTNGVALSDDNKTLYIANADNNCLTVFDVSEPGKSLSKGFIPVGWYPTNVKSIGKKIYVTNGKGLTSLPNPYGPNPIERKQAVNYQGGDNANHKVQYIAGLFIGTLSIIDAPSENQLSIYSQQVYKNIPYTKAKEMNTEGEAGNPVPMRVGGQSPIKHVFYIIKENRTYDQVLGDVTKGNGDTSLVLFGEKYTPNQHKLVNDFVLLDNFYVDAEVSADGHNWSMGAYATDYLEKTWPTSYGGRGGKYDSEGNREIANNKGGFIWNHCARNNVSYRTYGEFADDYKPNIPILKDHLAKFTGWDLGTRDTVRFNQWKRDFDSLIAANAVPQLNTLRFPNDHTEGIRKGRPTPFAHVADNDLAVGMFVDYLSKSPIWKESVVFILEDDAQNGPDHVDAHRSPVYVVGPYVKRNFVDHTMYSTSGVLRTMELILGMPPMTQYDAAATPLWRCFTSTPDFTAYNHLPANVDLSEKNASPENAPDLSAKFDWSKEDRVPDLVFNEILWQAIKGKPAPAPKHAAFIKANKKDKDDD